ncbi:hypothetical protein PAPYR_11061 [Paratrimastix pyriformis]|uniref:Uncharacterized protein n=1 Tax=Paratrimastix pyriformis TaxID=342808 RepID=A0ABQ8U6E7_9EUKA|nr:hypothetical protein PAPYR_11061 [Paratrimastix pyriformis]
MDFSTPTNIVIPVLMMQIDEFHRKTLGDDVRTPPRKIRFLLKIHTAGMDFSTPTNIAIPVLMIANRCVSSKNTWDDVGTPPRKIRFLRKSIPPVWILYRNKHRDTGSDDANR